MALYRIAIMNDDMVKFGYDSMQKSTHEWTTSDHGCGPRVTTDGPRVTTDGPRMTTDGPRVTTDGPRVTTCDKD